MCIIQVNEWCKSDHYIATGAYIESSFLILGHSIAQNLTGQDLGYQEWLHGALYLSFIVGEILNCLFHINHTVHSDPLLHDPWREGTAGASCCSIGLGGS